MNVAVFNQVPASAIAIIILVFVIVVIVDQIRERYRREAIAKLAAELGLTAIADGNREIIDRLEQMAYFRQGHDLVLTNQFQAKTDDTLLTLFDFRYTIPGVDRHSKTYHTTVVVIESDEFDSPEYSLRPQRFLDRLPFQQQEATVVFSDPAFSSCFRVKGENGAAIEAMFTPELRREFVDTPRAFLDCAPGCFVYREGRPKPTEIKKLLDRAYRLFRCCSEVCSQEEAAVSG